MVANEPSLILGIIGLVLGATGPAGVILWALNRKGANRRIVVEERTLETNQFTAITQAEERLRSAIAKDNDELREQLALLQRRLDEQQKRLDRQARENRSNRRELEAARVAQQTAEERARKLHQLVLRIASRAGIELTEEEQHILDQAAPTPKEPAP
jgi:flagellar biosynthesis GTPase FlhF